MKLILLPLLFSCCLLQAQQEPVPDTLPKSRIVFKSPAIIAGYHLHKNQYAEIGFGLNKTQVTGRHPFSSALVVSTEMRIDGPFVQGFKIGGWIGGGGGNLGLNIINYTDWHQNSLCIRPEVGFGYDLIRFVYGYNIPLTNKGLSGVNTHNFSVNLILNLKKRKIIKPVPIY